MDLRKKIVSLAIAGSLGGVGLTAATFLTSAGPAHAAYSCPGVGGGTSEFGLFYYGAGTTDPGPFPATPFPPPFPDPNNANGYVGTNVVTGTDVEAGGMVTQGGRPTVPYGYVRVAGPIVGVQCVNVP